MASNVHGNKNAQLSRSQLSEKLFFYIFLALQLIVILYPETVLHQSVQLAGITITPLVVMAPLAIVSFCWYFMSRRRNFELQPLDLAFLAALGYTVIRSLLAAKANIEIRLALEYAGYGIVTYYGAALLFREPRRLRGFIWVMVVSLLLVSAYEILIYLLQSDPLYGDILMNQQKSFDFYRGGSTLGQPVYLGAYLLQVVPLAIWAIFSNKGKPIARLSTVALLAAVLAGLLSFSKSAWIVGGMMAVCLTFLLWRKINLKMVTGAMVIIVLIVTALVIRGDLGFHLLNRPESYIGRQYTWKHATEIISEHPLFGVGLFRGSLAIENRTGTEIPVDNYYLTVLVEQGIIGAVLYAMTLALLFWKALSLWRNTPPASRLLPALIAIGLLAVLADATIFDAFVIWPHFILFWTFAGMLRSLDYSPPAGLSGLQGEGASQDAAQLREQTPLENIEERGIAQD